MFGTLAGPFCAGFAFGLVLLVLVHAWRTQRMPAEALAWRWLFVISWHLGFSLFLVALFEWAALPAWPAWAAGIVVPFAWQRVFSSSPIALVESRSTSFGLAGTYLLNHLSLVMTEAQRDEVRLEIDGEVHRRGLSGAHRMHVWVVDPGPWHASIAQGKLRDLRVAWRSPAGLGEPADLRLVKLGEGRTQFLYSTAPEALLDPAATLELISFPTGLAILSDYAEEVASLGTAPAGSAPPVQTTTAQSWLVRHTRLERQRFFLELGRLLGPRRPPEVTVQRLLITGASDGRIQVEPQVGFLPERIPGVSPAARSALNRALPRRPG